MSEQRLIDVNTLVGTDGLFATRGCTGNCSYCNLWSEEGCRVILEAPTVDVEPIVHGQWLVKKNNFDATIFKCSKCFRTIEVMNDYFGIPTKHASHYYPYCHCGAKMDGENNEHIED